MMLTNNRIKFVKSLHQKKFREQHGRFIAEGHKLAVELLTGRLRVESLYALPEWIEANSDLLKAHPAEIIEVKPGEMDRITALSSPAPVLAVACIPEEPGEPSAGAFAGKGGLFLALDDIRDPGNLGTILRIADWFGIDGVFCAHTCVDQYNPKVVQATMGSIARVKVMRCELGTALKSFAASSLALPVFGAFLEGDNLFSADLPEQAVIVIGSESHGIAPGLAPFINRKIFIPSFNSDPGDRAESLNASVAAAILCAEFRRRTIRR